MTETTYKGYWMVTNRCNLRCSYCVLENASHQLKAELDLAGKKELISHLYNKLGFRRLTLSGGEVLIIGKSPPKDFIELLRHIRQFKSSDPAKNLEIELYTNGTYLDENVASEMKGVVDLVAVTIDSTNNDLLTEIGRNNRKFNQYFANAIRVCGLLYKKGIQVKLHSVIGTKNHLLLPNEVSSILDALESEGVRLSCWKFYQYMSYEVPECDGMHAISPDLYRQFQEKVECALLGRNVRLHFKDNEEMNASLFNILSYGNAQYMRDGDSWTTSPRTKDLRSYGSMAELFAQTEINQDRFQLFHSIRP
jgi:molybdenum cofactor biosynthesis enzyme MoaA